jgi:D-sedoheptulose 7-phosphate isomerase
MANDLQKLASHGKLLAYRAIALTDNVPLITAWANDADYEEVFTRQLEALAQAGDLLIAITGSGNSPNIVHAVKWAKGAELKTIALLGFDGGIVKELADHVLLCAHDS